MGPLLLLVKLLADGMGKNHRAYYISLVRIHSIKGNTPGNFVFDGKFDGRGTG